MVVTQPVPPQSTRPRLGFAVRISLAGSGVSLCLGAVAAAAGLIGLAGVAFTVALVGLGIAANASERFRSFAFTVAVFAFVCAAMFFPELFTSWAGFELKCVIVPLIQVIMFGMGTTLVFADFTRVFRLPRAVLAGMFLQFTVMPLMGWTFSALFGLAPLVAAGLILVGSCPGGVSSNVITYIARGNVALSVTMTACSTMVSPLMTPLAMKVLAGQYVPIEVVPMMLSIVQMILLPVIAGLLVSRYAPGFTAWSGRWMPFVSMLSICIIIGITIGLSRDQLLIVGPALFAASVCHNAAGYLLGYSGARLVGLTRTDSRTVAIEVGMQNGGMATGLAFNVLKSEVAAMASAVFGPWSAVAGSVLASLWRREDDGRKRAAIASDSFGG